MSQSRINVVGLKEFQRGMRGIERGLGKGVRVALNQCAELVVDAARPEMPSITGAARASLRAQSTQTAARIAAGGPKAPYEPWLDFGGRVGRKKSVVRPFIQEGRYIYPTVARKRDEIQDTMLRALAMLAEENGVRVGG